MVGETLEVIMQIEGGGMLMQGINDDELDANADADNPPEGVHEQ